MKKWIFPIIAFLAAVTASIWNLPQLPDNVAIHFGPSGEPDQWVSKQTAAFLLPAIILLVPALVFGTARLQPNENERRRAAASMETLSAIVSSVLLSVHLFTIAYNLGYQMNVAVFAAAILGLMFIALGNIMPRLPQKALSFPRLSEEAYRKASRVIGRFMVITGFVMLFLTLLPANIIPLAFAVIFAVFLIVMFGSMFRYSR